MSLFPKFKISTSPLATPATLATQTGESRESRESRNPLKDEIGYRQLYRQTAEAIAEDCWALDPAWLLDHPELYQRIRALDDRLTEMEQRAASESEYRAVLRQLVKVVQDTRTAYEQEREGASERAEQ